MTQLTRGQTPSSFVPAWTAAALLSRGTGANQQPSSNTAQVYWSGIRPPRLFCCCGSESGSCWFLGQLVSITDCTGTDWEEDWALQHFSLTVWPRIWPKHSIQTTAVCSSHTCMINDSFGSQWSQILCKCCHFTPLYCYKGKVKLNWAIW